MYKIATGVGGQEDLDNLKNGGKEAAAKAEYTALMEGVKNKLAAVVTREAKNFVGSGKTFTLAPEQVVSWQWGDKLENPPQASMIDAVAGSYARQQLAAVAVDKASAELAADRKTYQEGLARAQKAEADFKALSAAFPKQVEDIQTKANELIAATRSTFAKDTTEYVNKGKAQEEAIEQRRIQLEDALAKTRGLTERINRIDQRAESQQDPFRYDQPHGKVLRKSGNVVDINLGSSDNARPGLTFSVQPGR
jgi:hypothetical protein